MQINYKKCRYCEAVFYSEVVHRKKCDDCQLDLAVYKRKNHSGTKGFLNLSGNDPIKYMFELEKNSINRNFTNPLRRKKGKV